jgi:hypothetical protein
MPKALILVADGSEEIEFVTPYDGKVVPVYYVHINLPPLYIPQLRMHLANAFPQSSLEQASKSYL